VSYWVPGSVEGKDVGVLREREMFSIIRKVLWGKKEIPFPLLFIEEGPGNRQYCPQQST
jgi:hypothetical protein